MRNIKETNLEYFTEWNNAETEEDKIRVNESWTDSSGVMLCKYYDDELYSLGFDEVIKRKRKTIIINGIEVVAPRYDFPVGGYCYWVSSVIDIGFNHEETNVLDFPTLKKLAKNGWFDSEDDIREFLAAIKGNTNE